ncbi:MAG: adenosylcobinamide-phosphate synthase CbiB [Bacteroidales bacterium]
MFQIYSSLLPLLAGWFADRLLGDPEKLPHPVVAFGKIIHDGEKLLNNGTHRKLKGALLTFFASGLTFLLTQLLIERCFHFHIWLGAILSSILVFFCLAGKTLITEVQLVFLTTDQNIDSGRKQLARIVGRDTGSLDAQQIRMAALETLAENLSDGVIAPLFWFCIAGVPGMMTYKMINTFDSMIGYKNERFFEFGYWAAKTDDVANYIPARLTAFLMLLAAGIPQGSISLVRQYGKCHTSPNSGYPEAALAVLLHCRFGGPNTYSGKLVDKPYIGIKEKTFTTEDMQYAVSINEKTEIMMVILVALIILL